MIVLHVAYSFPPDPPGGTEVYVRGLAEDLARVGITSVIAAPAHEDRIDQVDGLAVHRYATVASPDVEGLYGRGDALAGDRFDRVLAQVAPDVVHVHAMSPGCSMTVVEAITRRGLPLVFTYHTPDVSCPRGTLLLHGEAPCDGELRPDRCAACVATSHGIALPVASLLGRAPRALGEGLARAGVAGRGVTALRMSALLARRREALRSFLAAPDRIICLTPWVRDVLRANGVGDDRFVDSPHGFGPTADGRTAASRSDAGEVRIAHLGRVHPVKGTAILIEAFRRLPEAPLRLDIYGVVQDEAARGEGARLRALAGTDARITFRPPLPHEEVVPTLRACDAVAVPSQWMETGPLVVLEAHAAGVPVLGSAWGGVADKVRDGIDGLLVRPPASVDAWTETLRRCVDDATLLPRLRAGVVPPRPRADVARDMLRVYEQLRLAPATVDGTAAGDA